MKALRLCTLVVILGMLAARGALAAEITWKANTVVPESHPIFKAMKEGFADEIAKRTNGRMAIQIFPASQLGGERDVMQSLQTGAVEVSLHTVGILGTFVPEYNFMNLPFLINGADHFHAITHLPQVKALEKKTEENGFYLVYLGYFGARMPNIRTKLIESPKDFEGLNMRTMENDVHIATMRALGAQATPIPFPELYNALKLKVVDGMYNDPSVFAKEYI